MAKVKRLRDIYRFTNFLPELSVKGIFGDPMALVIRLRRRQKKRFVESADKVGQIPTIKRFGTFGTWDPVIDGFIFGLKFVGWTVTSALA